MRDIFDENTWFACNEALGKFLDLNEFRAQAAQAKRLPSFRAKFENLRLNRRIDANVQFITDADWMACADPLDMPALAGKPCYAGLGSIHHDRHERALLYWPDNGAVLPFFWLPEEGLLDRDRKEGGHYRTWRDAGLLEVTAGRAINFKAIIRRLAEINAEYDLRAVAYDRAFIKTFNAQCEELGVRLPLQEFGQGYVSMAPAIQALEAAVLDQPHSSRRTSDFALASQQRRDHDGRGRQPQGRQEARDRPYRRRHQPVDGHRHCRASGSGHRRRGPDRVTAMSSWPYSTQRWQRLRRAKLRVYPLCEACLQIGYVEPAAAVDHRTPINAGGDPYPPLDQLASLVRALSQREDAMRTAGRGLHAERLRRVWPPARSGPSMESGAQDMISLSDRQPDVVMTAAAVLCRSAQRLPKPSCWGNIALYKIEESAKLSMTFWRAGRDSTPDPNIEVWCSIQPSYRRLGRKLACCPRAASRRIHAVFAPPQFPPSSGRERWLSKGRCRRDTLPRSSPIRRRPRRPLQTGWEIPFHLCA